jgi:hypothetical protein
MIIGLAIVIQLSRRQLLWKREETCFDGPFPMSSACRHVGAQPPAVHGTLRGNLRDLFSHPESLIKFGRVQLVKFVGPIGVRQGRGSGEVFKYFL